MKHELKIKIPEDATLLGVIRVLNHMNLTCNSNDKNPEFQKWLYKHKDWIEDGLK